MFGWLKKLFGGKRKAETSQEEIDRIIDESGLPEARKHHYLFAHYALRSLALEDPRYLFVLTSPEGNEFLQELWKDVGDSLKEEEGEVVTLHPAGLEVVLQRDEEVEGERRIMAIVRLPEPVGIAEAYYVGLVIGRPNKPAAPPLRYYTLEVGFTLGPPRTVLGEWDTGSHYNYGDGPMPEPEAFADAIWTMHSSG